MHRATGAVDPAARAGRGSLGRPIGTSAREAATGAKGPRLCDFAEAASGDHRLVIRRAIDDGELAFFWCYTPGGVTLAELVAVIGRRWAVEECFQAAKGQVGLDHYQVRSWTGWYRHITLAMAAHAALSVAAVLAAAQGASHHRPAPPLPAHPSLVDLAPPPAGPGQTQPLPAPTPLHQLAVVVLEVRYRRDVTARRALPDDASELVRLRGVMLGGRESPAAEPGPWQAIAEETLRKRLAEPDGSLGAFVVDRPDRVGGLAACVIGVIEQRLGSPDNPSGEYGYVFNVATDPDFRRRGYARACMEAVIEWYRQRRIRKIDLRTSEPGEPLYRSLGFVPSTYPAMRLLLP